MPFYNSIFFISIAAVVAMLGVLVWRQRGGIHGFPEFDKQRSLMTPQQRALYRELVKVVGSYAVVVPRVNLSAVVKLREDKPRFQKHWQRVARHWLDFVVCSPQSISPTLAIKLETRADRKRRKLGGFDVMQDCLKSSGIPLIRLRSATKYDPSELTFEIRNALVNDKRKKDEELFVTEEYPALALALAPEESKKPDYLSKIKNKTIGLMTAAKGPQ